MLELEKEEELKQAVEEAVYLADELGNPDLLVAVQLIQARLFARQNDFSAALAMLQELINSLNLTPEQQAGAYFERFRISRKDSEARDLARALYEQLYLETPKYQYLLRLEQLRAESDA